MRAVAISPFRVMRVEELWLLWHFAGMIRFEWRMLAEPLETLQMVIDVEGPLMSEGVKARISEELSEARERDTSDSRALWTGAAMLYAATDWFCGLEFPKCAGDLWADPRLVDRARPSV